MAASTTPRYGTGPNQDITGRVLTLGYLNPAYAATQTIAPNASDTTIIFQQLAGAMTLNLGTGQAFASDALTCLFAGDGTSRTITFGTGVVVSAATLVLGISKKGSISFVFDGAAWVEVGRCVGA